MRDLEVQLVETEVERQAAFAVRMRVFVEEQGVPVEEELDDHDATAIHVLAVLNSSTIGTGRLLLQGQGEARIGRMAVDREFRRMGVGARILGALEEEARRMGAAEAVLHAQTYVKSFYSSHGYAEEGEVFLEAEIEHVQMRKRL